MYLYFDYKGTLLETVNDQALRQYNKGVNTVNIYIESEPDSVTGIVPDDGKIPSYITGIQYWFQLANGDKLNNLVYEASNKIKKTIPFDRNRDLRHFKYGKSYEFFSFQVPSGDYKEDKNNNVIDFVCEGDVFKSSGLVLMTVQALTMRTNDDGTEKRGTLSLERVAFAVEDAVILPEDIVSSSEFNWLLQQYAFGDYLRSQLVYMKVDKITSSHAFTIDGDKYSIDLDTSLFNRQPPKIGDAFLYVYENGADKGSNITMAIVENVTGDVTKCSFSITDTISIKGEKGNTGATGATPNIITTATVDENVGVPEVNVTKTGTNENPNFAFTFKNLKGETGETPNITATVSVNSAVGTPSAEVVRTGTNENPNLAFAFKNLKGETGETPNITANANVITDVGKPSVYVTKTGTNENPNFAFTFTNLKGKGWVFYGDVVALSDGQNEAVKISKFTGEPSKGDYVLSFSWKNGAGYVWRIGVIKSDIYDKIFQESGYNVAYRVVDVFMYSDTYPANGATFTPSVSKDGVLSWTNNRDLTNPLPVNIMGPIGPVGPSGPSGPSGEIALVYKGLYDTAFSEPNTVLILKFNNFNRTPKAGDRFVLFSTQSKYASCYVVGVDAESEDATCQFTDVVDTKGLPGAAGANGEAALMFNSTFVLTDNSPEYYVETGHGFHWDGDYTKFNRIPDPSDVFIAIASYHGRQYIVTASATGTNRNVIYFWSCASIMGGNGPEGVGISSANVKSTSETYEYTSTAINLVKTDGTVSEVVVKAKNGINPNTVSFIGTVTENDWQESIAYSGYGYNYSALMPFTGGAYATDTYVPDVVPSIVSDIVSGNFAPFANSTSTGVEVYAKTKPTKVTNFNVSLSHVQ